MRINYYEFPEGTPASVMIAEGCVGYRESDNRLAHWLDVGEAFTAEELDGFTVEDRRLSAIKVSKAKQLLKLYGGKAWTAHSERGGGMFDVTPIIVGSNRKAAYGCTYSRHL